LSGKPMKRFQTVRNRVRIPVPVQWCAGPFRKLEDTGKAGEVRFQNDQLALPRI